MKNFTTFYEFVKMANPAPGSQPVANPAQGIHNQSPESSKDAISLNKLISGQDIVATTGSPGMTFMGFADPRMVNAIIADPQNPENKQTVPANNIKAVIRGGLRRDVYREVEPYEHNSQNIHKTIC